MKAWVLCIASLFFGFIAYGQGIVFFGNWPYITAEVFARAPVYLADGVTLLSGPQFSVQRLEDRILIKTRTNHCARRRNELEVQF